MNELDDLMEDDAGLPGPGAYAGIYTNSSFTVAPKTRFQQMEVGPGRWQVRQYNPNLFQEQFIGPGYYENSTIPIKKKQTSPERFLSKATRFSGKEADMVQVDSANPGPGAYDRVARALGPRSYNKGTAARFGSGMERYNPAMINRKDEFKLGPGAYRAEVSQELLDRKRLDLTVHSSNLKSNVSRFPQLKAEGPPPGRYEPSRYGEIGGGKILSGMKQRAEEKRTLNRKLSSVSFVSRMTQSQPSLQGKSPASRLKREESFL